MTNFETGVFILSVFVAINGLMALLFMSAGGALKTSDAEHGVLKLIGMVFLSGLIAFVVYQ